MRPNGIKDIHVDYGLNLYKACCKLQISQFSLIDHRGLLANCTIALLLQFEIRPNIQICAGLCVLQHVCISPSIPPSKRIFVFASVALLPAANPPANAPQRAATCLPLRRCRLCLQ